MPSVSIPLAYSVPAAAALWSYLDAKYFLKEDVRKIYYFIAATIFATLKERRDELNPFYVLEAWAQKTPDKTFLLFEGKSFTYKQAYERVLKHGTWMKSRFGLESGQVVAMDFVNSDDFIWVWLGMWSIGVTPAFINYSLTRTPLIHSIKLSGSRVMLIDEQVFSDLDDGTKQELSGPGFNEDGSALEIVPFTAAVVAEIEQTAGERLPNSSRGGQLLKDMAILISTSGTTGLPKQAVVSWSKCAISAHAVNWFLGLNKDDVFYTSMPLYHSSASILGVCTVLSGGSTLALGRKFNRKGFWEDVRSSGATVIQYVGETCRYLLSVPPSADDKNHRVRLAFGNGLRPDVWPVFKKRFGIDTVSEFYAATEAPAALFNTSRNSLSEGCVGVSGLISRTLMADTMLLVELDEDYVPIRDAKTGLCKLAATGEPGELLFKLKEDDIESQFQGYFRNEGATTKKILHNVRSKGDAYFSTGDILRLDGDGRWFFCDRIGDTFRWKSHNVSTAEVAEALGARRDLVDEANVYGVQLPGFDGRAGCAAVTLEPALQRRFEGGEPVDAATLAALAAAAMKTLPRYAVPVFLRLQRDEGASNRTGTNKQQKVALRDEGVDPAKVEAKGDVVFWLPPGGEAYERFGAREWSKLTAGELKL
jgi:acyl-CoA synthetase (AMP-forming)/AMP-acid ligase II